MPNPPEAPEAALAPVFAALGDATRLRLLHRLVRQGGRSITQLAAGEAMSRQALTKHLQVLAQAGMVRGSRRGRTHVWHADPAPLAQVQLHLAAIQAEWAARLDRLQALVAAPEPPAPGG